MKAVFIDRDGTIGGGNEVTLPNKFKLFTFSSEAFAILKKKGYKIIAFTNQPDISKGICTIEDFQKELEGFGFEDVCICPHQQEEKCLCRKPSPYMINKMVEKYSLEIEQSYVIGDRWSDMLAGISAGLKVILVLTGAGGEALNKYDYKQDADKVSLVTDNLLNATKWISAD